MPSSTDMYDSDDEFIVIESTLPTRSKPSNDQSALSEEPTPEFIEDDHRQLESGDGLSVHLHQIHASNEVLVTIQPPLRPDGDLHHTNCDVVLIIDVSGSMGTAAELPDNIGTDKKEFSGLHILDLVRHAARTILESLNDNDRLAIVTFSNSATRVQDLSRMTPAGKALAWQRLQQLQPDSSTNLWGGISEGLEVFNSNQDMGNVQSMFILTDGAPNYLCPSQGYVKKLQPILKSMVSLSGRAPTLSTFGFGYYLKSDLMRSIAEVGRGSYAFIPDSGMIGTVFVHAVANLFSTFATSVKIQLQVQSRSAGISAPAYLEFETEETGKSTMINVERLQYGQSRDIVVRIDGIKDEDVISCTLEYQNVNKTGTEIASAECRFSDRSQVEPAYIDYHLSRHDLCNFLNGLSTRNKNNEHAYLFPIKLTEKPHELGQLTQRIKSRIGHAEGIRSSVDSIEQLRSLLADIENPDLNGNPHGAGQISLAIQTQSPPSNGTRPQPPFYTRWGKHYLPSILHAHMRQQCATFKDEGPLWYGSKSPLFIQCRDDLDRAFDKLPAPKPSLKGQKIEGGVLNMSRFHSRSNPCFAGFCKVRMADGSANQFVGIEKLMVGDFLWTPAGDRKVCGIVKTNVACGGLQVMYNIPNDDGSDRELWITPYHPIRFGDSWIFPANVPQSSVRLTTRRQGFIYSVLLERDTNIDAHIIDVGGVQCVTLGHGLVSGTNEDDQVETDVRVHSYFGDYDRVLGDLERLDQDQQGRWISGGVAREGEDGLATRFLRSDEPPTPLIALSKVDLFQVMLERNSACVGGNGPFVFVGNV